MLVAYDEAGCGHEGLTRVPGVERQEPRRRNAALSACAYPPPGLRSHCPPTKRRGKLVMR